ncbi:hypothetical protein [Rhodobacter ferrooxidans]|uniref:Uncharacterized protein n=1 Tax=Rhodobacter ferrooxidans TaxID=371731 RepID=C8RYX2_9RHOB|nr:hypothetical protein [Rhodobacter sp. SW2]EEW25929.1 hypothetical protein Rsw2DRAFT_1000 [Rhodobacter sp. SW2]
MSDAKDPGPRDAVADLVDSALKLSASVTQVVAEAVSGQPQPNRAGETPLQSIIRHGSTAATAMFATVMAASRTARAAEPEPPKPAPGATVSAGTTLRVPLSVDNPGQEVMEAITPRLTQVLHEGAPQAGLVVSFTPETLTVQPRDFEKLVVSVEVPADAAPGRWSVSFRLTDGADDAPITLSFQVVAAGS